MGRFRNREAERLNCYHRSVSFDSDILQFIIESGKIYINVVQNSMEAMEREALLEKYTRGLCVGHKSSPTPEPVWGFIFVKDGDRISTQTMRMRLKRICKRLNIYHKSPYKMRKTYDPILLDNQQYSGFYGKIKQTKSTFDWFVDRFEYLNISKTP